MGTKVWTPEMDQMIMSEYGSLPKNELAAKLQCSEKALKTRASILGGTSAAIISDDAEMDYTELMRANLRFHVAMFKAIDHGYENPPKIGVDRRPGTEKPRVKEAASTDMRGASCLVYAV